MEDKQEAGSVNIGSLVKKYGTSTNVEIRVLAAFAAYTAGIVAEVNRFMEALDNHAAEWKAVADASSSGTSGTTAESDPPSGT